MRKTLAIARIFEYSNTRVMKTKLTLTIEKDIVDIAKDFAFQSGTSLSQLTEDFFRSLTTLKSQPSTVHPIMTLRGSIAEKQVENWEEDYTQHLNKKYRS